MFTYTVNVAPPGPTPSACGWSSPNGVTDGLHIASSSGANLSGNINVPNTGGWQTYTTRHRDRHPAGRAADPDPG